VFDEAGEGAELQLVVDDEQVGGQEGVEQPSEATALHCVACGQLPPLVCCRRLSLPRGRAPAHAPVLHLPNPQVPEGVDLALMKMKQGERALITITDPK
jgi:hypothetical protein